MTLRFIFATALVAMTGLPAHADDPSFTISGKWNTDFGLTEFTESGDKVTGIYHFENGKIIGARSGNRLTAQWTQSKSSRRCDTAVNGNHFHGRIVFDFKASEFVGKWGYCDDTPLEKWSGKRVLDNPLNAQSKENLPVTNTGSAATSKSPPNPANCPQCPPWVFLSYTSQYLPLSAQAETWSDPKPFKRKSGLMTVQSRFTGQKGTTCNFEVQFNNVGDKSLDEKVFIGRPGKVAVSAYDHLIRIKLNPGANYAFGTEVRECPLNWGETKDMAKCASCEPIVYFAAD